MRSPLHAYVNLSLSVRKRRRKPSGILRQVLNVSNVLDERYTVKFTVTKN
jgi:hypothetical protein